MKQNQRRRKEYIPSLTELQITKSNNWDHVLIIQCVLKLENNDRKISAWIERTAFLTFLSISREITGNNEPFQFPTAFYTWKNLF